MTPKDIKEILGIDILLKNRKLHYIYVKTIYVNEQFKIGKTSVDIAGSLDLTHASVLSLKKRSVEFEKRKDYLDIKKAYKNRDKEFFDLCIFNINKTKPKKNINENVIIPNGRFDKKIGLNRVIRILRNHPKHRLWNVSMNTFTKIEYDMLCKLELEIDG